MKKGGVRILFSTRRGASVPSLYLARKSFGGLTSFCSIPTGRGPVIPSFVPAMNGVFPERCGTRRRH